MFIGEFQHTIDAKGRLIMPARFRDELGDTFVLTKGLDNCLFIYPKTEWQVVQTKLKALPLTNKDARAFVRFFFSGASECEADKQGRVLIPSNLREHAGLERDVVVIGVANRAEIWSKELWNAYNSNPNLSYDEIAEKMEELGI